MSPKIKRIAPVAAVTLVLALCIVAVLMREPLHKGKPVGYWVEHACRGYDANEAWEFRREVKDIGSLAVPRLRRKLRVSDGWRNSYRWLRGKFPTSLQQFLPDVQLRAEEMRYGAVRTLAMLGVDAKPAVADLIRLLPTIQYPVLEALRAIGPDAKKALPALHSMLLTNRDISLKVEIAGALWYIGLETNTVLEICTNAMVSADSMNAGALLSELGTAAAPAVPYALNVLQDTNHLLGTRANAATVLGAARVSTPEILAALLEGTEAGHDVNLRSNCAMALWRLDSQYAPLATRLVLEDIIAQKKRFPTNEQDFKKWLEVRGLDPQQSIPELKRLLEGDSPDTRKEAAAALERIETRTRRDVAVEETR